MLELENLKYVTKKLWARKSRSFLTILSIFVGISTIFVFVSFGLGLYNYVEEVGAESGVGKFIVQAKGGGGVPGLDTTFKLTESDVKVIQRTPGVKNVAPFYLNVVQAEKDDEKIYTFIMGHGTTKSEEDLLAEMLTVDLLEGRLLKEGDLDKVMLGYNYKIPDKIFEKSLAVGNKILLNEKKFEIVGFYEAIGNPGDDANIYITHEAMKQLFNDKDLSYAMIVSQVSNPDEIDSIVQKVEKELRKLKGQQEGKENFYVQTYDEILEQFSMVLDIIVGFIILIALISVVVSAINTANTMVTSVIERIPEIGIMKSIGATNGTIRNLFLLESAILGGLGGLFGLLLGYFITTTTDKALNASGFGFLSPKYTFTLFLGLFAFAVIVGTLSGVIVAIQASKQDPVDALRYE